MHVRKIGDADWVQVWPVVREIVRAQETFPYDPEMTEEQARHAWVGTPPGLTVVAADGNRIVGTAKAAVGLYRRHGFEVIGTVPRAFAHPVLGRIVLHLMHREL